MWFFALKVNVCFGQEIFFAFSAGFFVLFAAGSLVRRVRRDPMEVPMSNEKSGLPWFIYTYVMLTLYIYIIYLWYSYNQIWMYTLWYLDNMDDVLIYSMGDLDDQLNYFNESQQKRHEDDTSWSSMAVKDVPLCQADVRDTEAQAQIRLVKLQSHGVLLILLHSSGVTPKLNQFHLGSISSPDLLWSQFCGARFQIRRDRFYQPIFESS